MNNSIEKLFDQALAELQVENKYVTVVMPDPIQRDFVEKFAQLIVRECAEVCMKEIDIGWAMAPKSPWMAKQILEHFGVEE